MERFDLGRLRHAERQRWRDGDEWHSRTTCVAVGELAGGWWYVRAAGPKSRDGEQAGRAYPSERLARRVAAGWMRVAGGAWVDAVSGDPVEDRRPRAPIWG